jgi:hypothetical protein
MRKLNHYKKVNVINKSNYGNFELIVEKSPLKLFHYINKIVKCFYVDT